MSIKSDIYALLERTEKDMEKIHKSYQNALLQKEIPDNLKIDIKIYCENLRSILEYLANDIFINTFGIMKPNDLRLYFPIRYKDKGFEKYMPYDGKCLKEMNENLWLYLESIQPYKNEKNKWLKQFNDLNNHNKHISLVPQTKSENTVTTVSRPNFGKVSWNSNVKFSGNVSVLGAPINEQTQLPVANNLLNVSQIIWVDFRFEEIDVSAIELLQKSYTKIKDITNNVYNNFI